MTGAPAAEPGAAKLLERLTAGADGKPLELMKLCGAGVPVDADVLVCRRTFVALQVRVKASEQRPDLLHEYGLDPQGVNVAGKGGVYELQCLRSKHHLQVKVQPALGMEELLPRHAAEPSAAELAALLDKELWPFVGVYQVLAAFATDPARRSLPLAAGYEDAPRHLEWLLEDPRMLDRLAEKCPVFNRSYEQPPRLQLLEPERPKTRGLLLKALLEVKLLIIRAITQIRQCGDTLSDAQFRAFEQLMMYLYEGCCAGGVESQYVDLEGSSERLRLLVCGGLPAKPAADGAKRPAPADGALRRAVGRALELLEPFAESLQEADRLAGGELGPERAGLEELSVSLRRRLEEADALEASAAKRPRTEG